MGCKKITTWTLVICAVFMMADLAEAAEEGCYGGGSLAGAIIGTFLATLALAALGYLFYRFYWKNKKDKRLVLANDPENVKDEFAFDNPGFKPTEGGNVGAGGVPRQGGWLKINNEKSAPNPEGKTFLDDTFPESNRKSTMVPLWSKDFTGLGFEVSGSMRDGIYVSRVLRGGPAFESEKIHTGDRINSIRISFRNMVYEDALSILSFASPYELQLEVQSPLHNTSNAKDVQTRLSAILTGNTNIQRSPGSTLQNTSDKIRKIPGYDSLDKNWKSGNDEIRHPILGIKRPRCNSYGDANTLEKSSRQYYLPRPPASPNSTLDSSNQSKNTSLKKMLTDKIITSTLEKNKPYHQQHMSKEQRSSQLTTLDRENEKNAKNRLSSDFQSKVDAKNKSSEHDVISKPERTKIRGSNDPTISNLRISAPPDVVIIKDGGDMYSVKNEKSETQKKEPDVGKKGMKFGIRVLPPNVPDDGTISMNLRNSKFDMKSGNENGNIVAEIKSIDEVDKNFISNVDSVKENSVDVKVSSTPKTAPVVAKRREKPAAPIPNARVLSQNNISTSGSATDIETKTVLPTDSFENVGTFSRDDELNSSGIKRDSQGIPQEIPQHMMEAALYARNNRKSSADLMNDRQQSDSFNIGLDSRKVDANNKIDKENKNSKKSKGKAPSPPEINSSRINESETLNYSSLTNNSEDFSISNSSKNDITTRAMNFTDNFGDENVNIVLTEIVENKQYDSTSDSNRSDDMILNKSLINTSTPKIEKVVKRMRPDVPIQKPDDFSMKNDSNDDTIGYEIKPLRNKEMSDSLNNFFDDSKSNVSSNFEMSSEVSINQDSTSSNTNSEIEKNKLSSTTIELNSSDITIHNSPVNELQSQNQDENERKASSLGDLSRLETSEKNSGIKKPSQGTLERAQSLDISSEDSKIAGVEKGITPKKRKSNSVFDGNYYDEAKDNLPLNSDESINQILVHSKEPRLSFDISNISSIDGLNTFQKNRLKKASEWGNLEDAIILKKDNAESSNSGSSEIVNSAENLNESVTSNGEIVARVLEEQNVKLNDEINKFKLITGGNESNEVSKVKDFSPAITMPTFDFKNEISTNSETLKSNSDFVTSVEPYDIKKKPEVPARNKALLENNINIKPTFEIGTFVSDSTSTKYKSDDPVSASGKLSPKLEEKLTMIYDTNIPDDIKVSRHTLVSSLERPKSDIMKKILAQNPVLTSNIESSVQKQVLGGKDEPEFDDNSVFQSAKHYNSVSVTNPDICIDRNFDSKTNSTTYTLLNQPDIVNLRIKPSKSEDLSEKDIQNSESEFISNINIIGATSKNDVSSLNYNIDSELSPEKNSSARNFFSSNDNIVTISTDGSQPSSIITIESDTLTQNKVENFKNSIEINTDNQKKSNNETTKDVVDSELSLYNEIISELQKSKNPQPEKVQPMSSIMSSSKTYLTDDGISERLGRLNTFTSDAENKTIQSSKSVTVSLLKDEFGNDGKNQNTDEFNNRSITVNTTPLDTNSLAIKKINNSGAKNADELEVKQFTESKILSNIESQKPNINYFTENKTQLSFNEVTTVQTSVSETSKLYNRIIDNPHMVSSKTFQNSDLTISDLRTEPEKNIDEIILINKKPTSYKFCVEDNNSKSAVKVVKMIETDETIKIKGNENLDEDKGEIITKSIKKIVKTEKSSEINNEKIQNIDIKMLPKDYVTEIEVSTPVNEKSIESSIKNEIENSYAKQISSGSNENDMDNFLKNERRFSADEMYDSERYVERRSSSPIMMRNGKDPLKSNEDHKNKRHSDFDLPRNTHIKFRTTTYEQQSATPNRLSNTSEKRLSQIEILKSNFEKGSAENVSILSSNKPSISSKPSNIPIKLPEKPVSPNKMPVISPSKIPVLNSQNQKSASQENLLDKSLSLQRSPQINKLSTSTGNISITSIKSSSRNPSGK